MSIDITALVEKMRENQIPPKMVMSYGEANRLTAADPTGKKWNVGDKYYLLCIANVEIPIDAEKLKVH